VPKSRVRKRTVYTPPPAKSKKRKVSPPWVGPSIVICLVVGLAWIVVYYLTSGSVAGMSALGAWNLVVGFVFIIAGVILATTWRLQARPGELPVPDHDRDGDEHYHGHGGEHLPHRAVLAGRVRVGRGEERAGQ
jgi:prepilin signal peptidase PulO-like enzyme (type II secretory pathway)